MDAIERLKFLSAQMNLEPDGETVCSEFAEFKKSDFPVSHATLPNGKRITLLKTMQTSACERNCNYCGFRVGSDTRRATLSPDEMARAFDVLYRGKAVEGLFLSSGIVRGGLTTQDKLLATAEILRNRYHYRGYLHLKLMPGVEKAQVEQAMRLADRVSTNLEAPNKNRLLKLAPMKQFGEELLQPLRWAEEIRRNQAPVQTWNGRWASTVTQFVVGAVGESDLELLQTSEHAYRQLGLRRTYFMSFTPVEGTPFENLPPSPARREVRLYEASFLLRDYHFTFEDLPFLEDGALPQDRDPKLAMAQASLVHHPVDINRASLDELLRVPGIGPKSASRVLEARRKDRLRNLETLRVLGISPARAAPFILLDGRRPARQLELI